MNSPYISFHQVGNRHESNLRQVPIIKMSQTLLITIFSAIVCMTASQVFFSPKHSAPKPPIPPLANSCFNKTFDNLFLCQYNAEKKWQNDTDRKHALCCSTWEGMKCSFPYLLVSYVSRYDVKAHLCSVLPIENMQWIRECCGRYIFLGIRGICHRLRPMQGELALLRCLF